MPIPAAFLGSLLALSIVAGPAATASPSVRHTSAVSHGATKSASAKGNKHHGKAAPTSRANQPPRIETLENQVMRLPVPMRAAAFERMMLLTSALPATLISDAPGSGRMAANYSSGAALERLQKLAARSAMPGTANCLAKFAAAMKEYSGNMAASLPPHCAGMKELYAKEGHATLSGKSDELSLRWATAAVQQGLAQARDAGLAYTIRARPLDLDALTNE
ncbi:hypothetical protein [Noviherbaspirillum humi]|nr:hypothetical protein [Noviherbaspirillum humi]